MSSWINEQEALARLRALPNWNEQNKTIDLTGSDGHRYRILPRWHFAIQELQDDGTVGKMMYCHHPVDFNYYPDYQNRAHVQQYFLCQYLLVAADKLKANAAHSYASEEELRRAGYHV